MTTLGPSLTVTGDITSQEDITVHGTVKGTIIMEKGALVIAPSGKAEAQVEGSVVTVHGTVSATMALDRGIQRPTRPRAISHDAPAAATM